MKIFFPFPALSIFKVPTTWNGTEKNKLNVFKEFEKYSFKYYSDSQQTDHRCNQIIVSLCKKYINNQQYLFL